MSISGPECIATPAAAALPSLRLDNISARQGERQVLTNISLHAGGRTITSIHGSNGAGKSTLLRICAGLIRPTCGVVQMSGVAGRAGGHRIGLIAHQPLVYADLTVRENLELFARLGGSGDPGDAVNIALARFELNGFATERARRLSRGLMQRLAVARALIANPTFVLADEPFTGLDPRSTGIIEQALIDARSAGSLVLATGHDIEFSLRRSDRVLVLAGGKLVLSRSTGELTRDELQAFVNSPAEDAP